MSNTINCSICWNDLTGASVIRAAHPDAQEQSRHEFHFECLAEWISAAHYNCPLCRGPISLNAAEVARRAEEAAAAVFYEDGAIVELDISDTEVFFEQLSNEEYDQALTTVNESQTINEDTIREGIERILDDHRDFSILQNLTDRIDVDDVLRKKIVSRLVDYGEFELMREFLPPEGEITPELRGEIISCISNANHRLEEIQEYVDLSGPITVESLEKAFDWLFDREDDYVEEFAAYLLQRPEKLTSERKIQMVIERNNFAKFSFIKLFLEHVTELPKELYQSLLLKAVLENNYEEFEVNFSSIDDLNSDFRKLLLKKCIQFDQIEMFKQLLPNKTLILAEQYDVLLQKAIDKESVQIEAYLKDLVSLEPSPAKKIKAS